MIAVDTSLLAFAANRFAPQHARAARVLEGLANGDVPWALPWTAVHEFLRLVTHPHAVARPLGATEAWSFVSQITAAAPVRMLGPTERHDAALVEVMAMVPGGGLPAGFETAVALREHGLRELLSVDRGMERFPFLSVRNPLLGDAWSAAAPPSRRYRMLRPRTPHS
jgi:predicted nucleic acid-binding protein